MQLTPSRTVTVAGKQYTLDGSFATLRAVQEAFQKDVVQLLIGVMDMRLDEIARLVAVGSGQPQAADAIGQSILDDMGTMTPEYVLLKTELTAWLYVAVSPQKDREKKSEQMQALIDAQT